MANGSFIDRARERIQTSRLSTRTRGSGAFDSLRQGVQDARASLSGSLGRPGIVQARNRIRERVGLVPLPGGDDLPGGGIDSDVGVAVAEAVAAAAPGGATDIGQAEAQQFAADAAAAGVVTRGAALQASVQPSLAGLIDITGQETTGITAAQAGLPSRSTFSSLITGK